MYLYEMEEICHGGADISLKCLANIRNAINNIDDGKNSMAQILNVESRSQKKINSLLDKIPELDDLFTIHNKVGEGTFSTVYMATLRKYSSEDKKQFAIKHLIPTSNPVRIGQELRCLSHIGGEDNVVGLVKCIRKNDNVVFVMPYLPHEKFIHYVLQMDIDEIKLYMRNLLLALKRVHSFNIIHRDVKPSNFLYDRLHRKFLLVDFGLAEEVNKNTVEPENSAECIQSVQSDSKKRKRPCIDEIENDSSQHVKKRPALQPLTNTVNTAPVFKKPSTNDLKTSSHPPVFLESNCNSLSNKPILKENGVDDIKLINNQLLSPKRQPLSSNSLNVQNNVSPQKQLPRVNLFNEKNKVTNENCINNSRNGSVKQVSPKNDKNTGKVFQTLLPSKLTTKTNGSSFLRVQNSQVKPVFTPPIPPVVSKVKCECDGKPQVCNLCIIRKRQVAPRAGTPGFRPPEVLLKHPQQTTAVDIWAAGVIFLSLISGCYPFFRSPDDMTALAEIMTMFGTERIKRLAVKFGKRLRSNFNKEGEDLRKMCERLRRRRMEAMSLDKRDEEIKTCETCGIYDYPIDGCMCKGNGLIDVSGMFPDSAYNLLSRLLDPDHDTRITAADALNHPFLADCDN